MRSAILRWSSRLLGPLRRQTGRIRSRTDLLNHLIARKGYSRYLEIGVRDPRQNFDRIDARDKSSVDPAPRRPVTHRMTSDEFFARRRSAGDRSTFDLAFIDGLHLAAQVERDVLNCLEALSEAGAVVLHDCNPLTEDAQTEDYDGKKRWNGTVWKAWVKLRATRADLAMCVVDIDEGCGVISRGSQALFPAPTADYGELTYPFLVSCRKEALNLVSLDDYLRQLDGGAPAAPEPRSQRS
jgi:hypothetical protein